MKSNHNKIKIKKNSSNSDLNTLECAINHSDIEPFVCDTRCCHRFSGLFNYEIGSYFNINYFKHFAVAVQITFLLFPYKYI